MRFLVVPQDFLVAALGGSPGKLEMGLTGDSIAEVLGSTMPAIGRFQTLQIIGKGIFGTVYKAVDPSNQVVFAIREVREEDFVAEGGLRVALETVQRAIAMNDANIGRTLEIAESAGGICLVMEYVQGFTLSKLLAQENGFSLLDLVDLTRQVCTVLDRTHSQGLVHGNLHPGNVVQEWDGNIKIMDYGLGASPVRAQASLPPGLYYCSPEQADGQPLDRRSNLFSWAAILYELAAGKRPFTGGDATAVLRNIREGVLVFPETRVFASAALRQVLAKALSKDPSQRYATGNEFLQALEACQQGGKGGSVEEPGELLEETTETAAPVAPSRSQWKSTSVAPVSFPTVPPRPAQKPAPAKESAPSFYSGDAASELAAAPANRGGGEAPKEWNQGREMSAAPTASVAAAETVREQRPAPKQEVEAKVRENKPSVVAAPPAPPPEAPPGDFLFVESRVSVVSPDKVSPDKPVDKTPAPNAGGAVAGRRNSPIWQRRELQIGAGALLLLVLGAAGGYSLHRDRSPDQNEAGAVPYTALLPATGSSQQSADQQAAERQNAGQGSLTDQNQTITVLPVQGQPNSNQDRKPAATTRTMMAGLRGMRNRAGGKFPMPVTPVPTSAPAPAAPPVELPARLSISSQPDGAAIILDGQNMGHVTPWAASVPKGRHTIELVKEGFFKETGAVELGSGQSHDFSPRLTPEGHADQIKGPAEN